MSGFRDRLGKKLAQTRFGIFIIANSYIHDCYEWYRSLLYESDYTLEEIRDLVKADDKINRWNWLLARAKATHVHCNQKELNEMVEYLKEYIDENEQETKQD